MPTTLITDRGETLIARAVGSGSQVAITTVALGDGSGAVYAPSHTQTQLRAEQTRRAIDTRFFQSPTSWRVTAEFPPNTPVFSVREIGWLDANGELIAITAGLDMIVRATGGITYLSEFVLNFDSVAEGVVIVEAPDDELAAFALVCIANQAGQELALFRLSETYRADHGYYPGARP